MPETTDRAVAPAAALAGAVVEVEAVVMEAVGDLEEVFVFCLLDFNVKRCA